MIIRRNSFESTINSHSFSNCIQDKMFNAYKQPIGFDENNFKFQSHLHKMMLKNIQEGIAVFKPTAWPGRKTEQQN